MSSNTINLTVSQSVFDVLKCAMPKTNKAEMALNKYIKVLEQHLEQSLIHMDDNMYRFFKNFYVSTHALSLEVGQFVIDGKKQYLDTWLQANGLDLIKVHQKGLKGSEFSTVSLTKYVTMTDAMDINQLRKKTIDELDALLNDKSLTDEDFFYKLFPDFVQGAMTTAKLKNNYDFCPVNIKSLKQYIVWLTHKANLLNDVERQMLIRQAKSIIRIAEAGNGELPMKKNPSHFGRMYYTGRLNVQSVKTNLRSAMLGDCYSYDIRLSVVSWKLGMAWTICSSNGISWQQFHNKFNTCLTFLSDKKKFRETVRRKTFGQSSKITPDKQLDVIKQVLTAISFGARKHKHGWIDQSGNKFNPAIVKIIADEKARIKFYACPEAASYIDEQKTMDKIISEFAKQQDPSLLNDAQLQSPSGRISNSKLMSYLYQNSESIAMDVVRDEVKAIYQTVLANVHDAIFIKERLRETDRKRIELVMRSKTGLPFWYLDEDKISGFTGISDEVRQDEIAHKALMAQLEQQARGYKPLNF